MPLPTFEEAKRLYVDEQKSLGEICTMSGLSRASQSRLSTMLKAGGVEIRPTRAEIAHQKRLERERERALGIILQDEPPTPTEQKAEPPIAEQAVCAVTDFGADFDDDDGEPKRKVGRPRGSKSGSVKAKPAEGKQTIGVAKKGDNAKVLKHNMAITEWGAVDMFSKRDVKERVKRYFSLCVAQDMSPTLPGLALAFGVSRFVLQRWVSGADVSPDVAQELYRAVCLIDADAAQKLTKGMVHPKSGEFLMKNTLGYRDETTVVQEHVEKRPSVEAIKEKYAKLLGE